jgi:FlaA1/EpsC-like NDP-sugar epimerase
MLELIGRKEELFTFDISSKEEELKREVNKSRFLVLGGAGSIGQAVVKEIFKRNPQKLHVVDISENNMVELVRDIRSTYGYISGEFKTFSIDIGSFEYDAFINADGNYDYVLNLSAIKHVRSERDPYTLMRMIDVNIFNTVKTIQQSTLKGVKKYFCVSSDKAANPVNMMGASKRIMELYLLKESQNISISTARFANVAFSDGSLLYGFNQRLHKKQPIVAPNDIKRYFVIPKEAGELCLMSCIFGENRDIFFPKLSESLHLISFSDIAVKYLDRLGYEPFICDSEKEARDFFLNNNDNTKWPCLFTPSDTSGEKDFEEFYSKEEIIDTESYHSIGAIKNNLKIDQNNFKHFESQIAKIKSSQFWNKQQLVSLFKMMLPNFKHIEKDKYLDDKM